MPRPSKARNQSHLQQNTVNHRKSAGETKSIHWTLFQGSFPTSYVLHTYLTVLPILLDNYYAIKKTTNDLGCCTDTPYSIHGALFKLIDLLNINLLILSTDIMNPDEPVGSAARLRLIRPHVHRVLLWSRCKVVMNISVYQNLTMQVIDENLFFIGGHMVPAWEAHSPCPKDTFSLQYNTRTAPVMGLGRNLPLLSNWLFAFFKYSRTRVAFKRK